MKKHQVIISAFFIVCIIVLGYADCKLFKKYMKQSIEIKKLQTEITHLKGNTVEKILRVGEGKQYTTLSSAIKDVRKPTATNRYKIELYYDTYDVLLRDLTADDLSEVGTSPGLMIPPYTRLVGMGQRNLVTLTLANTVPKSVRCRISTLNLKENAEIENITVYGSGCRYAVHDDYNSNNPVWKEKTIKNCHIISDETAFHRAYGAGYRSGMTWNFLDCIFENGAGEKIRPFSAHNNNSFTLPSALNFYNCQFRGGTSGGAGFGSLNDSYGGAHTPSPVITTIRMYGCKVISKNTNKIFFYNEAGTGCQVSISGYGNNFTNSNVSITTGDSVDYSNRKMLWQVRDSVGLIAGYVMRALN